MLRDVHRQGECIFPPVLFSPMFRLMPAAHGTGLRFYLAIPFVDQLEKAHELLNIAVA
jgi:hypothetical protein